jgi:predicted porin
MAKPGVELSAKLGIGRTSAIAEFNGDSVVESHMTANYGAEVRYSLTKKIITYASYSIQSSTDNTANVLSAGLAYQF